MEYFLNADEMSNFQLPLSLYLPPSPLYPPVETKKINPNHIEMFLLFAAAPTSSPASIPSPRWVSSPGQAEWSARHNYVQVPRPHTNTHRGKQQLTVPNCKLRRPKTTTTTTKCGKQKRKTRRKFCRFFSCVKKLSARCALRQNDNLKCPPPLPTPFQQFPFPNRVEICSPSMPHVDYGSTRWLLQLWVTFPAKNLTVENFKIFVEIEKENERWKMWGPPLSFQILQMKRKTFSIYF